MSSEVWNVTQNKSAQEYYDSFNQITYGVGRKAGISTAQTQLNALVALTSVCNNMTAAFNEIEQDQQQYVFELEDLEYEYGIIKGDIDAQISQSLAEIKVLEVKEQDGTITEEESKELADKKEQLNNLFVTSDTKHSEVNTEFKTKQNQISSKYLEKQNVALDYGELTIQKGEPWANIDTEIDADKKELYKRCIFNRDKAHKVYGMEAVEAGTELIDKVKESGTAYNTISKKKI